MASDNYPSTWYTLPFPYCCVSLSLGPGVCGHDVSSDDHPTADAADPVSSSTPGPAAAAASNYVATGKAACLGGKHFKERYCRADLCVCIFCRRVGFSLFADSEVALYFFHIWDTDAEPQLLAYVVKPGVWVFTFQIQWVLLHEFILSFVLNLQIILNLESP